MPVSMRRPKRSRAGGLQRTFAGSSWKRGPIQTSLACCCDRPGSMKVLVAAGREGSARRQGVADGHRGRRRGFLGPGAARRQRQREREQHAERLWWSSLVWRLPYRQRIVLRPQKVSNHAEIRSSRAPAAPAPRSLSDFGRPGCKSGCAVHISVASCPIEPLWGGESPKICPRTAEFSPRPPKPDRLLAADQEAAEHEEDVHAHPAGYCGRKRWGSGGTSGGSARIHCANSRACAGGTARFGITPPQGPPCPPCVMNDATASWAPGCP